MIGTHPVSALAPLEYRYALDAAMSIIAGNTPTLVQCHIPELAGEVRQRIPYWSEGERASACLWVEPMSGSWMNELKRIEHTLAASSPLIVIASRPLAALLKERYSWGGKPLGLQYGGLSKLCRAIASSSFVLETSYGIHSILAVTLNQLSQTATSFGRPDLGDRLHFAMRLRYCTTGPFATLSTVALLISRRKPESC